MQIEAADHPLAFAFRTDGALETATTGPYQVHGRAVPGQNDNGDFTFAPMEQTCNLALLLASKTIPFTGGASATTMNAATGTPSNGGGTLSTPQAPLGNATLSIVSGFAAQPGVPNPLAGHPYVLLRDSYADTLAKAGITVPGGMSPFKYVGTACGTRSPDCQKAVEAIKASAASAYAPMRMGVEPFLACRPEITTS